MLRLAVVHLVAAVLVVCPYVCLWGPARGTNVSSARGSRFACSCCSRCAPANGKDGPAKPDSGKMSGTCLCHGAVVGRHVAPPDPGHEVLGVVAQDAARLISDLPIAQRNALGERASCHFPAAETGREVRALIASFLL